METARKDGYIGRRGLRPKEAAEEGNRKSNLYQ